jgi:hypothetical protein
MAMGRMKGVLYWRAPVLRPSLLNPEEIDSYKIIYSEFR